MIIKPGIGTNYRQFREAILPSSPALRGSGRKYHTSPWLITQPRAANPPSNPVRPEI
jgi:hypothetical protein